MLDIFRCAVKNLFRKKGRNILTVSGIAIGVASVIIISNISQCGSMALSKELDSLGINGISISINSSTADKNAVLSEDELAVIRSSSLVEQAMPIIMQTTEIFSRGEEEQALLWGIDGSANKVISLNLLYGRFINSGDILNCSHVCMVDETYAKERYGTKNIVGRSISILCNGSYEDFEIIGVIKTGNGILQNMMGNYFPTFMYLPYSTVEECFDTSGYNQIALKINGEDPDLAGEKITDMLTAATGYTDSFSASNLAKQKQGLDSLMNIITLVLSAVGAVSLVVASLSIMNVMLVSVSERTREIGIKKAIGAKRGDILKEFLFEAGLISLCGSIVGISLGMIVSYAGLSIIGAAISPRMDIIVFSVIFTIITGIIFGLYPANKASKLKPVEALRIS